MTWVKDTVPHADAYILDFYRILWDVNAASAFLELHDVQERASVQEQIEGNGVRSLRHARVGLTHYHGSSLIWTMPDRVGIESITWRQPRIVALGDISNGSVFSPVWVLIDDEEPWNDQLVFFFIGICHSNRCHLVLILILHLFHSIPSSRFIGIF